MLEAEAGPKPLLHLYPPLASRWTQPLLFLEKFIALGKDQQSTRSLPPEAFPWASRNDTLPWPLRLLETQGVQNDSPQNVPLWPGAIWVEGRGGPKDTGRAFYLPLNCLKEFR